MGNTTYPPTAEGGVSQAVLDAGLSALDEVKVDGTPGVKVYRALLTQSGTDAPVATVLENSLGAPIVWAYTTAGRYTGTLADAFTVNKTFIVLGAVNTIDYSSFIGIGVVPTSTSVLTIDTRFGGDLTDWSGLAIDSIGIEILVYP